MLGDLVRTHRRRRGWSQEDLAARSGMSVRGLRNIEAHRIGAPRPATVRLLADAFGLQGAERDGFCQDALSETVAPAGVPAQLPLAPGVLAGRDRAIAVLNGLVNTPVVVLSGTAGVGKTVLALHWAHSVAERFPDGQLYVDLRGFDPGGTAVAPSAALCGFLDALGVPAARIPAGTAERAAVYRSLMAGKRILVLLDNARDAEQVRPLLPGTAGCPVVVTSRAELTGLVAGSGAHPIVLDLLSPEGAADLLAARLGADRVRAEPEAVREIVTRCARLPLALAVVAAHAAVRPSFPLAALAAELRLDSMRGGDPATDLHAVFSWSRGVLSPGADRMFRLLGLHPGPDVTVPAAASLAAVPRAEAAGALTELTRAHLLTEHRPGRFTFHDLLREYAAEQSRTHDSAETRDTAQHRLYDHYVHSAFTAALEMRPDRHRIPLTAPLPGVVADRPAGHDRAVAWFTAEQPVLLAAVSRSATTGFTGHTWRMSWGLTMFLLRQGCWDEQVSSGQTALLAAGRAGEPDGLAAALDGLAHGYTLSGLLDDAATCYRRSLDIHRELRDPAGQAHLYQGLAKVAERQGRPAEAIEHAQTALDLFRVVADRAGQATALNMIGWCHTRLGDHRQAVVFCTRSLWLARELGDTCTEAVIWDSLGSAHSGLGEHTEAVTCYQRAVDLCRELGERFYEAESLRGLGDAHQVAGQSDAAHKAWRESYDILVDLGHPGAHPDSVRHA